MRVQDPAKYAEVLFGIARPTENWSADKIKRMFGTGEQDVQLPVPIWVHLTYQTAFVDDAGKLQIRRDIYDLDSRTLAAIKSERGMVEPMQERKREEVASTSQRRALRKLRHRASSRSSKRSSAAANKAGRCRRAASRAEPNSIITGAGRTRSAPVCINRR